MLYFISFIWQKSFLRRNTLIVYILTTANHVVIITMYSIQGSLWNTKVNLSEIFARKDKRCKESDSSVYKIWLLNKRISAAKQRAWCTRISLDVGNWYLPRSLSIVKAKRLLVWI